MRVLFLCTGNSCRSQMAEGFLKAYRPAWEVFSAGVQPADRVHPMAMRVMQEAGIDLTGHRPKDVRELLTMDFDYVITVCAGANERCPVFSGSVRHRVHRGFEDPAIIQGNDEEIISAFRRIRDQINSDIEKFARAAGDGRSIPPEQDSHHGTSNVEAPESF